MKGFLAALMMFTRLPLWRVVQVEKKYYSDILLYWPLVGFLTGLTTWGILVLSTQVLPLGAACILAIAARLILTGALHEDGLADFFDGFGGGRNKEQILHIMKDSRMGSYGTIGLIVYFLLYFSFLFSLSPQTWAATIIGADVLSKLSTAAMISTLPYARTEASSKTQVLYRSLPLLPFICIAVLCLAGLTLLSAPFWALIPTLLTAIVLRMYLKHKINGYTGDCCGASVLLAEQAFYLGSMIFYNWQP